MKKILKKIISVYLAISLLVEIFYPSYTKASNGPLAPEFSSFEPVGASGMVNEFTGDFSYNLPVLNIPGPNGSGYALSLSYHSGVKPEEEASWVGYGWTLNPGAINRIKKGFADDINGGEITYYNKLEDNYTLGYGINTGANYEGIVGGSTSLGIRFNNLKGYGHNIGQGLDFLGCGASYNWDLGDQAGSYSAYINPVNMVQSVVNLSQSIQNAKVNKLLGMKAPAQSLKETYINELKGYKNTFTNQIKGLATFNTGSQYGIFATETSVNPMKTPEYTGKNQQYSISTGFTWWGVTFSAGSTYSYSEIDYKDKMTEKAFGYIYSNNATNDDMMDYYNERENPFQKNDNFLPMPVSNPDIFTVSGEGIGGAFRFYAKEAMQFSPSTSKSETKIESLGDNISFPAVDVFSTNEGSGSSKYEYSNWEQTGYQNSTAEENFFPRFEADLGGSVNFGIADDAYAAELDSQGTQKMKLYNGTTEKEIQDYTAVIDQNKIPNSILTGYNDRANRSSFIGYHTNEKIQKGLGYNLAANYSEYINRSDSTIKDGIGEFVTYNEAGIKYNYGLPVYCKNEGSLSYGLDGTESIENNQHVKSKDISDWNKIDRVNGQYNAAPYASAYLLTDITTPDYIDRTQDGISADDFGGFTKFNYKQAYGSQNKGEGKNWFKWRIPFDGLLYEEGSLSDPRDDAGYAMYGMKEVYYLESIETKTHIAKFIISKRKDGLGSATNEDAAFCNYKKEDLDRLYKLDKIELYTKDKDGKPDQLLQVTHFEYDYSLMKGKPNSIDENGGTLTLKKVWTDYNGIYNANKNEYQFIYEYPLQEEFPNAVTDLYADLFSNSYSNENPDYEMCNVDAWGNYHSDGVSHSNSREPWHCQKESDPSAWHLKQINLPGGGNIIIQYEEDEYQFVQNYPAMVMTSLTMPSCPNYDEDDCNGNGKIDMIDESHEDDSYVSGEDFQNEKNNSESKYYVSTSISDLATLHEYKKYLKEYFLEQKTYKADGSDNSAGYETTNGKNLIYAKFLFELANEAHSFSKCNTEYIDAYLQVEDVNIDDHGLYIKLGKTEYGSSIREVALDFVKTNRQGILNSNCSKTLPIGSLSNVSLRNNLSTQVSNEFSSCSVFDISKITKYLAPADPVFAITAFGCNEDFGSKSSYCQYIKTAQSYLRLPVFETKKGGGVRVKRLLTYDSGINGNEEEATLNGKEYVYQLENGKTSGVATNEPQAIREECSLVQALNLADDQTFVQNSWLFGKDKRQVSGPIGETLMPNASVGYSRVVVKDIYEGTANPGFEVKEFYTAYDFPTEVKYSGKPKSKEYSPFMGYSAEELFQQSLAHSVIEKITAVFKAYKDFKAGDITVEEFMDIYTEFAEWMGEYSLSAEISETVKDDWNDLLKSFDCTGKTPLECSADILANVWDVINVPGTIVEALLHIVNKIEEELSFDQVYVNQQWYSQGYTVIQNLMHGQPHLVANYEGSYSFINKPSQAKKITETTYTYYKPGTPIPVRDADDATNFGITNTTSDELGKTVDIVIESKKVSNIFEQVITNTSINDVILNYLSGEFDKEDIPTQESKMASIEQFHTNIISKVITYPAIAKKIESYQDGIKQSMENLAFNPQNGKSIVSVSYDEFNGLNVGEEVDHDGALLSFSVPASFVYDGMGQKSYNEGFYMASGDYQLNVNLHRSASNDNKYYLKFTELTPTDHIKVIADYFVKGDMLAIYIPVLNKSFHFYINENKLLDNNRITLSAVESFSNMSDIYPDVALTILQSHKTNQLSTDVGSIVKYGFDCMDITTQAEEQAEEIKEDQNQWQEWQELLSEKAENLNTNPEISNIDNFMENFIENIFEAEHVQNYIEKYKEIYEMYFISAKNSSKYEWAVSENYTAKSFSRSFYRQYVQKQLPALSETDFLEGLSEYKSANPSSFLNKFEKEIATQFNRNYSSAVSLVRMLNTQLASKSKSANRSFSHSRSAEGSKNKEQINLSYSESSRGKLVLSILANGIPQKSYDLEMGGKFIITKNNNIAYLSNNGIFTEIETENMLENIYEKDDCVLKASAITLTNKNTIDNEILEAYGTSTDELRYLTGENGKWRVNESWAYNSEIVGGNQDELGERVYKNAGVAEDFYGFNWMGENQQANWINVSNITQFSPSGQPLEDKNMFNIYSTSKYGYDKNLPILVAGNAQYNNVGFESFENNYGSGNAIELEDGLILRNHSISKVTAHSGSQSLLLNPEMGVAKLKLKNLVLTHQLKDKGLLLKLWVKASTTVEPVITFSDSATTLTPAQFTEIARVWDWKLYELKYTDFTSMQRGDTIIPVITFSNITKEQNVWIDDIRYQPANAEMNCYVYDPVNYRLLTSFDSQHFGLYYQYNAEGKLVRQLVETENGKRTVAETQYHLAPQSILTSEISGIDKTDVEYDPENPYEMHSSVLEMIMEGKLLYDAEEIAKRSLEKAESLRINEEVANIKNLIGNAPIEEALKDPYTKIMETYVKVVMYHFYDKDSRIQEVEENFKQLFYKDFVSKQSYASKIDYNSFSNLVSMYRVNAQQSQLNVIFK